MLKIPLETVIIPPNRQRREFPNDAIADLANSIESKGLMHPIVVRDDCVTLVAGERRLKAIMKLHEEERPFLCHGAIVPMSQIPVIPLGELDDLALQEAELEENTVRLDLTLQERTQAIAGLHALRQKQNPKQTFKDTAAEVYNKPNAQPSDITSVSNAVIISANLNDPDVAKATTESEAMKIIRKKALAEIRGALAQTTTPTTSHLLEQGDALDLIAHLDDERVDVICTDPPYGIGANTFGDQSGTDHQYDDSADSFNTWAPIMARELYRVAKRQAHLYWFCDIRWFTYLKNWLSDAGWSVWATPLIWYKGNQGILPRPDHGPRRCYELIIYAIKGDKPVIKTGALDVLLNTNRSGEVLHAAEKPVSLYTELLSRSCIEGDTVLDPFCGSGPIFPAANELHLTAIGFELAPDAYATAKLRMEE